MDENSLNDSVDSFDILIKKKFKIFYTSNPVMFICDHYETVRTEIDLKAENLIMSQFNDKKDQTAINDINAYRDKLIDSLYLNEKTCISNCKQNFEEFSKRINLALEALRLKYASNNQADENNSILFELKRDLLLNKTVFFVKIFKVKFPNYFGSLVAIHFYLNEDMITVIK